MTALAEKQVDEAIRNALDMAECKRSLSVMIWIVDSEAHRIEGSERARLLAGLSDEPHWEQIERVSMLLAVMRFLENCRDKPDEAMKWLRGRRNGAS